MKKLNLLLMGILFSGGMMLSGCVNADNPVDPKPEKPQVDERVEQVIPEEIRTEIEQFIPIYDGVTPPNVEGSYYMDPEALIGTSLSYDQIGKHFSSEYQKFSGQDMVKNTINMVRVQGGGSEWMKGTGAFISGSGDNFTIYFDMEGESSGIPVKEAIVLSGTKTPAGIKNLTWGFILKEKGDDPHGYVVPVGSFRIAADEDGMSESVEWPYGDQYGARMRTIATGTLECLHNIY